MAFEFDFLCSRLGGFWCTQRPWPDLLGSLLLLIILITVLLALRELLRKRKFKKFR